MPPPPFFWLLILARLYLFFSERGGMRDRGRGERRGSVSYRGARGGRPYEDRGPPSQHQRGGTYERRGERRGGGYRRDDDSYHATSHHDVNGIRNGVATNSSGSNSSVAAAAHEDVARLPKSSDAVKDTSSRLTQSQNASGNVPVEKPSVNGGKEQLPDSSRPPRNTSTTTTAAVNSSSSSNKKEKPSGR